MQITYNTSGAYHVSHTVCHVVRMDSSATELSRTEIEFISALFLWLKPLTDKNVIKQFYLKSCAYQPNRYHCESVLS